MYKIKYYYTTGDSFNSCDETAILEYSWDSMEKAKEALKRIKEHYEWYKLKEHYINRDAKPPSWWKVDKVDKYFDHHRINLTLDNGKDVQFSCPWCGVFETLNRIEIVVDETDTYYDF